MKASIIALLAVIVSTIPASARIGETQDEINKRFGTPKSTLERLPGARTFAYSYGLFTVEVVFVNGKSVWEWISTHDARPITEDNIKEFLKGSTTPTNAWRFNRRENNWERSGKPKLMGTVVPDILHSSGSRMSKQSSSSRRRSEKRKASEPNASHVCQS